MVKLLKPKKEVYEYIAKIANDLTMDDLAKIMGLPPVAEMKQRRTAESKAKQETEASKRAKS
ncbi:hypothetical protein [Lentilactobacillus kisonensis]|uniref:Uncharacterized protein n=2 Tax=Lentilactobacillus kisonensis TaxID=481722 RepID=H1LFM8_9LACO|nr:hypothetical protein [Lentilactobacillus kisonensis]EHO51669.1 hypothetical protein HMPREF9104_01404 [Lentilactobacillus kisonensis F0435]KRL23111.1 hypothetical protein FC98_GL001149 [Lentilactobacillus kisonensis DSM 19906 = JCM 15041]